MAEPTTNAAASRVPRTRQGSPPSLLLTLLGDYWWNRKELLPSAALVELLAEFEVTDVAARAALSRLVKQGLLVTAKSGRNTFHGMTPRALRLLDEGAARIFDFGRNPLPWSGQWSMVAFSIPESSRSVRGTLRTRLQWLGFAPLYDGLWVSPHDRHDKAIAELSALGVTTATAFRAVVPIGSPETTQPQTAWDLENLSSLYQVFIQETRSLRERLEAGGLGAADALVQRTTLMDAWRAFPARDPELPWELLPADWPRSAARALFLDTYDRLGGLATAHIQEVIARHKPEIAAFASHHRPLVS